MVASSRNAPPSSKSRSRPLPNFKSWFTRSNSKNACGKETTRPRYPLRKGHWPDLRSPSSRGIAHSGITSPEAPHGSQASGASLRSPQKRGIISPLPEKAARDIPWLVELSRYCPATEEDPADRSVLFGQLERLEPMLAEFGKLHDRNFDNREKGILEGLASTSKGPFEAAHVLWAKCSASQSAEEVDASPDPWWIAGKICFVFEDHAGAAPTSTLDATKARQVSTHPNWIRANVPLSEGTGIYPVLVSPVTRAEAGAVPILARSFSGL